MARLTKSTCITLVAVLFLSNLVYSSKILYIFPVGCKSTTSFNHKIIQILIDRGHQVWTYGARPLNDVNPSSCVDIGISEEMYNFTDNVDLGYDFIGTLANTMLAYETQNINCERCYLNKKTENLMKNVKFDLVLTETDACDCFFSLAFHFDVPVIGISTNSVMFPEYDIAHGNPANPSCIRTSMSGFSTRMSFFQRLSNTVQYLAHLALRLKYVKEANSIIHKYGNSKRTAESMVGNFSLIFYNNHFTYFSRPLPPNTVEIAGIHIKERSALPSIIKKFIDEAQKGVIFVSFGSLIKCSSFPKELHEIFIRTFSQLPYSVIWKHDKPEMVPNITGNILAMHWLPQTDILAEEKTSLFISHAGFFSTVEAIHFGVPMLTVPVFYDQFTNAATIEELGIGLKINFEHIEKDSETLKWNILQVLNNKRYKERMQQLSIRFKDRPLSPKDSLIYWCEYVIRHKGAPHLRVVGTQLPFYQYFLLDVILFLIIIVFVLTYFLYVILRILFNIFFYVFNCTTSKIKQN